SFTLDTHGSFGRAKPMKLELAEPTWVMTNLQTFPWSELAIDGQVVPFSELRSHWGKITLKVPAGTHKVTTRFRGPPWWRVLRPVSVVTMFAWCVVLLGLLGCSLRRRQVAGA